MSCTPEGISTHRVQITANKITLDVCNSEGWNVTFDKNPTMVGLTLAVINSCIDSYMPFQIRKEEVDAPGVQGSDPDKLPDYPPKFSISVYRDQAHEAPAWPKLVIRGVDIKKCSFEIINPGELIMERKYHACMI